MRLECWCFPVVSRETAGNQSFSGKTRFTRTHSCVRWACLLSGRFRSSWSDSILKSSDVSVREVPGSFWMRFDNHAVPRLDRPLGLGGNAPSLDHRTSSVGEAAIAGGLSGLHSARRLSWPSARRGPSRCRSPPVGGCSDHGRRSLGERWNVRVGRGDRARDRGGRFLLDPGTSLFVERQGRLIAAIELISPRNKDRASAREIYQARYLSYLHEAVNLLLVDVHRRPIGFSFADQIAAELSVDRGPLPPPFAVSYRVGEPAATGGRFLAIWDAPLTPGSKLPTLPLPLDVHSAVPVDLERTYTAAAVDAYLE